MVFKSDKMLNIFIGLITGTMGVFSLLFAWAIGGQNRSIMYIMNIAGVLLVIASAVFFTYSSRVEIDKNTSGILKTQRILFMERKTSRSLNDFRSIAIGIMGGQNQVAGPRLSYIVVLVDANGNVFRLPGIMESRDNAINRGEELSKYTNLPFDATPHTLFFNKLL